MRNSYQLAGQVKLPGFLGDLQTAGQNFGITNTDIGLNALNYFGGLFADKVNDKENQAYQDYWRRQYQMPSTMVNPFAFGDPNQMAMGGRVKLKGPGFKFKGDINPLMSLLGMMNQNPLDTNQQVAQIQNTWSPEDWDRLGVYNEYDQLTGQYMATGGGVDDPVKRLLKASKKLKVPTSSDTTSINSPVSDTIYGMVEGSNKATQNKLRSTDVKDAKTLISRMTEEQRQSRLQELNTAGYQGTDLENLMNQKFRRDSIVREGSRVNATGANALRTVLPVPKNAAQMISKRFFNEARMDENSLDDEEKLVLYNTIQNAVKRTGKTSGGTEYEDYASNYGTKDQFNAWFNRGQVTPADLAVRSITNPGFRVASTVGRGKYFEDPETGDIVYTDVYDWNSREKNFKGDGIYQNLRNNMRASEDKNLNKDKNEKYRMNFILKKAEIDKLLNPGERLPEKMFGGPIPFGYKLDKRTMSLRRLYQDGGEVNYSVTPVDSDEANIEAEVGEYILGIGGGQDPFSETSNVGVGLYKIGGNKHYNGGTKLKASPGDFIFSDDKSLAFSKEAVKAMFGKDINKQKLRTPAKLASVYSKLNDFINESQSAKTMPIDRKTALLNVENMMDKLADIAVGQEALKGFPSGIPAFAQVSIDKRSTPSMESGDLNQAAASLPMAKLGGQVKYPDGGVIFPLISSLFGEPWKGDKSKDKKGVFKSPKDNQFPGNYPDFEKRIKQAGFTGNINDNRQIQRFLYDTLSQTPQGRNKLGQMWNQYGITNSGISQLSQMTPEDFEAAGLGTPVNGIPQAGFDLAQLNDPNSLETNRLQTWGNFYDDNKIGVRTRLLADSLPPPPINGFTPGDPNLVESPFGPYPTPSVVQPPVGTTVPPEGAPPTTRNYNTPVNPNIAELYGFMAANRRYPSRYPTAQRFYEGENIDATINAGFQPISAQPVLNNIQRQMNVYNQNNSGYGPISAARNSYAFTEGLNAQNNAIAQTQIQNVQRKDQQTQSLVQNQALKGQYRLQLQDKYLRELETLNNNREQASKNRMAQTSNLLNSFVNRAYTQKYSNAMMDNFQIDANGNLIPTPSRNLKDAVLGSGSGNQMNTQLRYIEEIMKLAQRYGIKGTSFFDDVLKGAK